MAYAIQNKRVSKHWYIVLREAAKHVRFLLNSGQRTMAEQWALYRQNMSGGRPKPGHALTALPSPFAPHIRVGRQDHAIDVNSLDGGETRLQRWLEKHGVAMSNPVRGESWHMEAVAADLRKLAMRIQANDRKIADLKAREKRVRADIIARVHKHLDSPGLEKLLADIRADIKKYERWFA